MKVFLNILKKVLLTVLLMFIELLVIVFFSIAIDPSSDGTWPVLTIMVLWILTIFLIGFANLFIKIKNKDSKSKDSLKNSSQLLKDVPIIEKLEVVETIDNEHQHISSQNGVNINKIKDDIKTNNLYDFACFDFETSNNELKSACSIGIAAVKNNEIVNTFYTLLNPPTEFFDYENTKINGISKNDVITSPKFNEVWDQVKHFIDNSNFIVAHNSNFDMSVLKESLLAYNLEIHNFKFFDSMSFCSKVYEGSSKKLINMCEYFGVELKDHHNGLEDSKACASIVIQAVQKSRFKTIYSYLKGFPSITIETFNTFKSQKTFRKNNFNKKTHISEIEVDESKVNINHPLYDKTCVITGKFENYDRDTMIKKILEVGGNVKTGVSRNTDFLFVGEQDLDIVGLDGMSNKEEKAYELINQGYSIEILSEQDFMDYFK